MYISVKAFENADPDSAVKAHVLADVAVAHHRSDAESFSECGFVSFAGFWYNIPVENVFWHSKNVEDVFFCFNHVVSPFFMR